MPWFVLHTRSRAEKSVADGLRRQGLEVFCPLMLKKRKWSDRTKLVEEPLFRSYCFIRLPEVDRTKVFTVPGVVRYLFWLGKPAVVKDHEIDLIKDLLNDFEHGSLEIHPYQIRDLVRIDSGLFMGREGEVQATQGKKIFVKIDSIGLTISIDITKTKVKKIDYPLYMQRA